MNRGECKHLLEIWEEMAPDNDDNSSKNRMGEALPEPKKVGEVYAKKEFRGGGLLTGRMADSVLTETTQKFTWPYYDYPNPIADKNWIVHEGKNYQILYTLDEDNKHEWLQVFTKEQDYK